MRKTKICSLITVFVVYFFLIACNSAKGEDLKSMDVQQFAEYNDLPQIEVSTVSEKDYWEHIGTEFLRDCVPNADSAISVASCILSQYQAEGYFIGYTPQMVEFQDDPGVWVVTFWENVNIPQATFSIAIRMDSAEVLRMWVCE